MKKNVIITALLIIYTATFIYLFIRLRGMSGMVLEELAEKNIYYILGFMFITGISATLYLILYSNNKKYSLSAEHESGIISFEDKKTESSINSGVKEHGLDTIKSEIQSIFNQAISYQEKTDKIIQKLCSHFEISQVLLYAKEKNQLTMKASYAFIPSENDLRSIAVGEGLTGQAAADGKPYFIKDIPEGYMKVISGLGESLPKSLLIIPCADKGEVKCVFELSSLKEYSKNTFDEIISICNYVSDLLNK